MNVIQFNSTVWQSSMDRPAGSPSVQRAERACDVTYDCVPPGANVFLTNYFNRERQIAEAIDFTLRRNR